MRIIFIGTPDFAAYSLKKLIDARKNIVAVITAPDRKAGRGQKLKASAVKQIAVENEIDCLQPTNLKSTDFIEQLKSYRADFQIVVAFRMLPKAVWDMPPKGTMNLHASLLPYYRGAAPINWAIINGEKKSGVSTFLLQHEIDTGKILKRSEIKLQENETAGSLHDQLMMEGAQLILKSLEEIESGEFQLIDQETFLANGEQLDDIPKAPKLFKEDCKIDWNSSVKEIDQLIRGLSPYPTAFTRLQKLSDQSTLNLKLYLVRPTKIKAEGQIGDLKVKDNKLLVGCKDYYLEILELHLEGKKRISAAEFLNGNKVEDYEILND